MNLDPALKAPPVAPTRRVDDFESAYANNVHFEPTVYDLKIIFGQSDLSTGTEVTEQHTAITMPWALVKLALYFLQLQITFHEMQHGKIRIPDSQLPARIPDPSPEQKNDPVFTSTLEIARKLREDLIASL